MPRSLLSLSLAMASLAAGCATEGSAAREEARDGPTHCTTSLECSPGEDCIRPRGDVHGLCGRLVDERATPTTSIERRADPCRNDFDCPVLFRCELTTPTVGICIRQ